MPKPPRRPTKIVKPVGLSNGMKSHGGQARKAAGFKSMKGAASLDGVVAHRPDAKSDDAIQVKAQQFIVKPEASE